MADELTKLLKNPKVQLALFTLLSVIMAIGFFGDPNISGTQTVASTPTAGAGASGAAAGPFSAAPTVSVAATQVAVASSKFFIATLSPMAAGFALIQFIISKIDMGISKKRINKQNKKKNINKTNERYKIIENEKKILGDEYEKEYKKLLICNPIRKI